MRLPLIIRTDVLRKLVRRRLLISLPLAASIVLAVSSFSQPAQVITGSSHHPHTTVLRPLDTSADSDGTVLGDSTGNDSSTAGNGASQSSSTTVTSNNDGATTAGNDTAASPPAYTAPAQPSTPADVTCNPCSTIDKNTAVACPDYCAPPPYTPPGSCGCGGTPGPSNRSTTLCPMYACLD